MITEEVDQELSRLASLVRDCTRDSNQWNIIWERIDRVLDKRGKLSLEANVRENT